ncbi:hypothetical protein [Cronobacter dublinensis]|uniref:hypothetical protein n=1 Tax=Cronobacter dublinensis TaxID=413497 RepID=UPI000CFBA498|nr:hypothetical protein [Cronobacter dublinensis]
MITFDQIDGKFQDLYNRGRSYLKDEAIQLITLQHPVEPKDELYFNKLVSWGYVLLFESFPLLYKRLAGQVRQLDNEKHKYITDSKNIIHALRTIQCHNMPEDEPKNRKKIILIDIWFEQNAPESERKWQNACNALCEMLFDILSALCHVFDVMRSDPVSFEIFVSDFVDALKREWEPHSFDKYIQSVADDLGILGINVVGYRANKLDEWRALAALFDDRESARSSIERKIKMELIATFGKN